MESKNFENKRWETKDQEIAFRHRAALELIKEGTVLDLGCGDGLFLQMLKDKNIYGVGLDFSEEAVKKCQVKGIEAKIGDITKPPLPFADNSFDYLVMLDVLEHLYFPETLLAEAVRVSKQYIVIGVPNFNAFKARLQMLFGGIPESNQSKKGHVFWFNYKVLKEMLARNGLQIVDIKVNTYRERTFLIGRVFKLLVKLWPSVFALSFVLKVRKSS